MTFDEYKQEVQDFGERCFKNLLKDWQKNFENDNWVVMVKEQRKMFPNLPTATSKVILVRFFHQIIQESMKNFWRND